MKVFTHTPPRDFVVGANASITIRDCAHVALEPDEQVTFTTPAGGEYDVVRKSWGFYATPSLNSRLPRFKLRPALIRNNATRNFFVLLVEEGRESDFETYLADENLARICWLNDNATLEQIETLFSST